MNRSIIILLLLLGVALLAAVPGTVHLIMSLSSTEISSEAAGGFDIEAYEPRDWGIATVINNISAYENFLALHPAGSFASEARARIAILAAGRRTAGDSMSDRAGSGAIRRVVHASPEDDAAWQRAGNLNTVAGYIDYLDRFPSGHHAEAAERQIHRIEAIRNEWENTARQNTPRAYRRFAARYPSSIWSASALERLEEFDEQEWQHVMREQTVESYRDYFTLFPGGHHAEQAEAKIIHHEVDEIFRRRSEVFPMLHKTEEADSTCPDRTKIILHNASDYSMTIFYSGPESRKIRLYPHETSTFGIRHGTYRMAAKVNTHNAVQFAGEQSFDGGEYTTILTVRDQR